MCGICGVIKDDNQSFVNREQLQQMNNALRHRGPDDAGIWWSSDGRVGLAQRRLAIIDLSPGGHQPMTDISGQLCITFNGEIYNYLELRRELEARGHRFRTASDTEVILEAYHAWGVECLSHLNGMFAFALYDNATRQMFIARDRAGEKPLFYWHTSRKLLFASELKALMASSLFPRVLDLQALNYYLAYGYVPGEMCILKGVRKLAQGQAMTYNIDTGDLRRWRYWKLPPPPYEANVSAEELTNQFETLLEDSVRRQMIADVPVGILLSGGIDSSLVTAMAARVSPEPVKTFTISFPGHGTYDESPHARLVAQYFGTEHTELAAEPATVELLPKLARQYDEPMADSSMVPSYLVSRLVREHATVALGGDGGDELFAGYRHYSWLQQQERIRGYLPSFLRHMVGETARRLPVGFRGRNHLIGLGGELSYSVAHVNLYFDQWARRRLLSPIWGNRMEHSLTPENYKARLCMPEYKLIRQATEADFQTTMVDAYLVKVDRASMLNGLEVRAPFLDHRIIEFAFGCVPNTLRAIKSQRKILPRRLAKRLLPSELDLTRKQGFSMPLAAWFKGKWGAYVEFVLREADPQLFDQSVIQSLIAGQRRGYSNTARLFALTMFELWRREYRIEDVSD